MGEKRLRVNSWSIESRRQLEVIPGKERKLEAGSRHKAKGVFPKPFCGRIS